LVWKVGWVLSGLDVHGLGGKEEERMKIKPEVFVALGLVIGGLFGVLLDNIPIYTGAGLAIGAGLAAAARRRQGL
jgi:hypothetical protein